MKVRSNFSNVVLRQKLMDILITSNDLSIANANDDYKLCEELVNKLKSLLMDLFNYIMEVN